MANEIDINIGSFNLDSTNKISIGAIEIRVAKSLQQADLAKANGSIIPVGKRKNITVRIRGTVIGSNYDALRTNLDALKAAFESESEQSLTIDDDRVMKVQYSGFSYSYRTLRTFADFAFDLIASDPFWYAVSLTSDTRTPTSGVAYNLTPVGNARTRAKVTFTNASGGAVADNIKFQNVTTGETLQYRGSLANTKALVVNNRVADADLSVLNDSTDDLKNFEGDFITLQPGVNSVKYTGHANVSVKVEYYEAYY